MGDPITCPCCKSENVEHKEIHAPGHTMYVIVFDYWVCKVCGVMFQKEK